MNIKKLIASVVIALGAWMSVGVVHATNYNFTFTDSSSNSYNGSLSNAGGGYYDGTGFNGLFAWCPNCGGDASTLEVLTITSASGNPFYLPGLGLGGFGGYGPGQIFPFNVTFDALNAQGNLISSYIASNTAVVGFGTSPGSAFQAINVGTLASSFNIYPTSSQINADCICLNFGTTSDPIGPGRAAGTAPEMNASFIPQVGLLLGCLFFLFGRKKENTELMLTA